LFNQEITIRLDEPADPLGLVTILKLTQVILKWLSPPPLGGGLIAPSRLANNYFEGTRQI